MKEAEEEERKARLGPGGLDPVEVFESLPEVRKKKFSNSHISNDCDNKIIIVNFLLGNEKML